MLADAGQKCVTTSIVYEPWSGQTYDSFDTMVNWIKAADGAWRFDYTVFDWYVEFCERCGITEQINCYSMLPTSHRFRYFDEATGDFKFVLAEPGTHQYEDLWRPFLVDFAKHLHERGWLQRTTIAIDDRPVPDVQKIIPFLRETAPQLRIAYAGGYYPKIESDIHDLSVFIKDRFPATFLSERISRSSPTTFFVCCTPSRPNTFTVSPPAESAWFGWFAASRGFSGFLRWAYNSWVEDPMYDTRAINWPAGDCFLIYPGARSSIRFERLREGIQEYEKIRILRSALIDIDTPEAGKKLRQLEDLLSQFTYHSARQKPCKVMVRAGRRLLVDLSRYVASNVRIESSRPR